MTHSFILLRHLTPLFGYHGQELCVCDIWVSLLQRFANLILEEDVGGWWPFGSVWIFDFGFSFPLSTFGFLLNDDGFALPFSGFCGLIRSVC